jgi:hypothetical protein
MYMAGWFGDFMRKPAKSGLGTTAKGAIPIFTDNGSVLTSISFAGAIACGEAITSPPM